MKISEMIIQLRNACRDEDIYSFAKLNENALNKCRQIYKESAMEEKSLLKLIDEYGVTCGEVSLAAINKMISFDVFLEIVRRKEEKLKEIELLVATSENKGDYSCKMNQ